MKPTPTSPPMFSAGSTGRCSAHLYGGPVRAGSAALWSPLARPLRPHGQRPEPGRRSWCSPGERRPTRPDDPLAIGSTRPGRGLARHGCLHRRFLTNLTDISRTTVPLVSQTSVTDGAWRLLRLVWDGGSHRCLYVDGREVAADTRKLGTLKFSTAGFNIGAGKALEPGSFWSGLLDDIRIYNRAIKP